MQLATVLTPLSDENLQLAAQCGVTDLVARYPGPNKAELTALQRRVESFGLTLSVIEGGLPLENIKLGSDDGTELEALKTCVRQLGDAVRRLGCADNHIDWTRQ